VTHLITSALMRVYDEENDGVVSQADLDRLQTAGSTPQECAGLAGIEPRFWFNRPDTLVTAIRFALFVSSTVMAEVSPPSICAARMSTWSTHNQVWEVAGCAGSHRRSGAAFRLIAIHRRAGQVVFYAWQEGSSACFFKARSGRGGYEVSTDEPFGVRLPASTTGGRWRMQCERCSCAQASRLSP
jgi:hypothetical protein